MIGLLLQTTQPDNQPLQSLNLGSITGITVATMLVVEVLKRTLCRVKVFTSVPVFVYAGIVSILLSVAANRIILIDGVPVLAGNIWKVVWAAVISALGSSGFYTWLRNPQTVSQASYLTSPKDNDPPPPTFGPLGVGLILILFTMTGCQNRTEVEHVTLREGMDQSSRTIRAEHKDWAQKLMVDSSGKNHADQLPRLTPFDVNNRMQAHAEYENLVNEDRKRDSTGGSVIPFLGASKPPPVVPTPVPGTITAPPLAKPAAAHPKAAPTTRPAPKATPTTHPTPKKTMTRPAKAS